MKKTSLKRRRTIALFLCCLMNVHITSAAIVPLCSTGQRAEKKKEYKSLDDRIFLKHLLKALINIDDNQDSPLSLLYDCIKTNDISAIGDELEELLHYIDSLVQSKRMILGEKKAAKLQEMVSSALDSYLGLSGKDGQDDSLTRRKTFRHDVKFKEGISVHHHTRLHGKLRSHGKASFDRHARFKNSATFKKDAKVEGNFTVQGTQSVQDLIAQTIVVNNLQTDIFSIGDTIITNISVVDNLSANTISAHDAIIENLTVSNLTAPTLAIDLDSISAHDIVVDNLEVVNCIDNLCATTVSAVDASMSGTLSVNEMVAQSLTLDSLSVANLALDVLSAQDAVIDNLEVTNCVPALCVNDLSIVDASISGTLSINDAIIDDAAISRISATDIVVQDLTVVNCIDNLCVNGLSAVDASMTGTLSVNEIVAQSLTLDSLSGANLTLDVLSAQDAVIDNLEVTNCVPALCVNDLSIVDASISGTLSINDAIIDDAAISRISATDIVVQDLTVVNCIDNLCVNGLSAVDASMSGTLSVNDVVAQSLTLDSLSGANLTLDVLSAQDAVINTLEVTNCVPALCVNDLSIVDASISGMLSMNDAIVGDVTALTVSATDIVVQDLTVVNCIDNLCVNGLSAVDASMSGTLSVNDVVAQSLTLDSLSGANLTLDVLSAQDAVINTLEVTNCVPVLCVENLSVVDGSFTGNVTLNDSVVNNLTVTGTILLPSAINVTDATITNLTVTQCIDDLCITDASMVDGVATNLTVSNNVRLEAFNTPGVIHNDALGNVSSSLVIDGDIANATISTIKLATAGSASVPSSIVVRDGSGNFITNMITVQGTVTNPTDVATKAYVDAVAVLGLAPKEAVVVISTTDQPLLGLGVIDGVALNNGDRVLLVGQTNPIENGIWIAQAGAWVRAADLPAGLPAGQAYVLVESGATFGGSSWVVTDPAAVVDTDPLPFAEFSLPSDVTGANVGIGTGLVFRDKVGNVLNFKTLQEGTGIVITDNPNEIVIATTATSTNVSNTLVSRDLSGNFSAGTITAALNGNATTATTAVNATNAVNFSGALTGDVTGTQGATVVATVGGQTSASIASGTILANTSTSANIGNTIIRRNALGGFSADQISVVDTIISGSLTVMPFSVAGVVHNDAAGVLSSSLLVNADISPIAAIVDTKLATISTAGKVANSATTATSTNTPNTIVLRDGSGNFSAGTITANLNGTATAALSATGFAGALVGDVTGTQNATVVGSVGGQTAANVASGATLANTSTSANTASSIIRRSATGGFNAGNISIVDAAISGDVVIDDFNIAGIIHNNSSGLLSSSLIVNADISASAAIADTKLATISTVGKVANSATTATSANIPNTIVLRDGSGNFSAGTITANLNGNANSANSLLGALLGDVVGLQGATVVATVGGLTAGDIASAALLVDTATDVNVAGSLVLRDATGSISAGTASLVDTIVSGNIDLPHSTATVGNILKQGLPFICNPGTDNTFIGVNAGSLVPLGSNNVAVGVHALDSTTTGSSNTTIGVNAGAGITTGSNNVLVGFGVGANITTGSNNIIIDGTGAVLSNLNNTIQIGSTQTTTILKGTTGLSIIGALPLLVGLNGQLGISLSSAKHKQNIRSIANESASIYNLNPVSFTYKTDETDTKQYGLIAEEVEAVFPELVSYDEQGDPKAVHYEMLPVLLLNEMQKQSLIIAALQNQLEDCMQRLQVLEQQ